MNRAKADPLGGEDIASKFSSVGDRLFGHCLDKHPDRRDCEMPIELEEPRLCPGDCASIARVY